MFKNFHSPILSVKESGHLYQTILHLTFSHGGQNCNLIAWLLRWE